MIVGQPIEASYNCLLPVQACCVIPRRDLAFDFRIVCPTIQRLIAVGADVFAGRGNLQEPASPMPHQVPAAQPVPASLDRDAVPAPSVPAGMVPG